MTSDEDKTVFMVKTINQRLERALKDLAHEQDNLYQLIDDIEIVENELRDLKRQLTNNQNTVKRLREDVDLFEDMAKRVAE